MHANGFLITPGLYFYLTLVTLTMFGIKTWSFHAYPLSTLFLAINSINSETCTMLLERIKGFYHGITKIFLLGGS